MKTPLCFSSWMILLLGLLSVCGCGKEGTDCYVLLNDAAGVTAGSEVRWRGTEVGSVSQVASEAGKVRVDVDLLPAMEGQLRQGVKAKAMKGVLTDGLPVLELFGGQDPAAPVLAKGSRIEEASALESFPWKRAGMFGVVAVAVLIFLLVLKGIKRLLAFVIAVLFLVFAGWVFKTQWQKHHADVLAPDVEAKLTEMANRTVKSPEAAAVWESMKTEMGDVLARAKESGKTASGEVGEKLKEMMMKKAAELDAAGKAAVAREMTELGQKVTEAVASPKSE